MFLFIICAYVRKKPNNTMLVIFNVEEQDEIWVQLVQLDPSLILNNLILVVPSKT
jgi:hypothetical protein